MNRRHFHRIAGLAAGGVLIPRVVSGAWLTTGYGSPRFQLASTPDYGVDDMVLNVEGPIPASAVVTASLVPGAVHHWRIATDGRTHYYGRLSDSGRLGEVAEMVNSVTIPFLNALHGTSVGTESETPFEFELEQNYPNPFNPATTIPFVLEDSGPASLRIYDVMGREIATLVDGQLPAGRHEAHWNAGDLASGTYLAVLQAGSATQTRRLVLIK